MIENAKFDRGAWATSKIASLLGLALLAIFYAPALANAQTNLLCNPNLSAGSGDSPQCWQHDPYALPPEDRHPRLPAGLLLQPEYGPRIFPQRKRNSGRRAGCGRSELQTGDVG